jgi:hypothetical protein
MSTEDAPDEALLRRYLLGLTSADETERFDELSVTSDEFATQLQAVEYDLVDAYVAGELSGATLEAFRLIYPAVADGRAEIGFAQTLLAHQTRSAPRTGRVIPAAGRGGWTSGSLPQWILAVAATLVLGIAAWLVAQNSSLRRDIDNARSERTALEQRARALQQELDQQKSTATQTTEELSRLRDSLGTLQQHAAGAGSTAGGSAAATVIASFVLQPGTRGGTEIPTITLPAGADVIRLQLPLEGGHASSFTAALRDAASNQVVWRGTGLHAVTGREKRTVAITVPATLLKPGTWLLELNGAGAGGVSEPLGPYPFQVVIP